MNCRNARLLLASEGGVERSDAVRLRTHLEECPGCRDASANLGRMLATLHTLSRMRVEVDVTRRVMEGVRKAGPLARPGLERGAMALLGLAGAALVAEGLWILWVLLGRGGAAEMVQPLRSAWKATTTLLQLAVDAVLFVVGLAGRILGAAAPILDALTPWLPWFYGAALVGLTLMLLISLAVAQTRLRPIYGATR